MTHYEVNEGSLSWLLYSLSMNLQRLQDASVLLRNETKSISLFSLLKSCLLPLMSTQLFGNDHCFQYFRLQIHPHVLV